MNEDHPDATEPLWRVIGRTPVHSGRVHLTSHEVLLPSGAPARYEVDESVPAAVAVLLILEGDRVLLTRQYRHPVGRWIHDLPGGAVEAGETAEAAARRECEEEVGLSPDRLVPLHVFFPNPGRSAWPVHLFVAESAHEAARRTDDESEQVRHEILHVDSLDRLIRAGDIVDPSLLIARHIAAIAGYLPPPAAAR